MINHTKRVLLIGRDPDVLQKVKKKVEGLGVEVEGTTDAEQAADQHNAKEFDLIVFGSGVVGPTSEKLREQFSQQKADTEFLDAFAPIALKQIDAALKGGSPEQQYVDSFQITESGEDLIVKAQILKPCTVRLELYKIQEAPKPQVELIDESEVSSGSYEQKVDAHYLKHGHMIYMDLNDDEYCLHRLD